MLFKSHVISVAFFSERVKSDKFCSEALISAWGSFMCRKCTTRDPWLYFPCEGSHTQDFYALKKNPSTPSGLYPRTTRENDNHGITGVDMIIMNYSYIEWKILQVVSGCWNAPEFLAGTEYVQMMNTCCSTMYRSIFLVIRFVTIWPSTQTEQGIRSALTAESRRRTSRCVQEITCRHHTSHTPQHISLHYGH